jgi:hypothetical protein
MRFLLLYGYRSLSITPQGARLRRTPTPLVGVCVYGGGVRPAKVQRGFEKRGMCAGREVCGGESPGHTARNLPRGCVSAGPTWSLATRRIGGSEGGALGPRLPGRVSARGAGVGVSAGAGRGGGAAGRRGGGGREGPGHSGRGPPGAGRHLFRVFPRIIDVPLM